MLFSMRRSLTRLHRHWAWARSQGLARLVEEDQLDPRRRARAAWNKWRWRRDKGGLPGEAVPVFLVGVQRSGTNMIVRGLEEAPEVEVHNENDRRAFERFRLRSLPEIRRMVERSHHRYVLFKPLCDSHRTDELLDDLNARRPGLALWAWRSVDGRVASALAKFGDVNLRVLSEVAAGRGAGYWQAERLSPASLELLRSFDYSVMSPATAAALFWYVRNHLLFDLGLDRRPDVAVVSYDALLAEPEARMRAVCDFLGFSYRSSLVAHIAPRPSPGATTWTSTPGCASCAGRWKRSWPGSAPVFPASTLPSPAGGSASEPDRDILGTGVDAVSVSCAWALARAPASFSWAWASPTAASSLAACAVLPPPAWSSPTAPSWGSRPDAGPEYRAHRVAVRIRAGRVTS